LKQGMTKQNVGTVVMQALDGKRWFGVIYSPLCQHRVQYRRVACRVPFNTPQPLIRLSLRFYCGPA
jgi:hypothetical protein